MSQMLLRPFRELGLARASGDILPSQFMAQPLLGCLDAAYSKGGRMVVIVFRSRLKPGMEKEIGEADLRMAELAETMPGYLAYRQYVSADGEGVAVVEFESHETAAAWRQHPEHLEAQRLGKERWFSEYRITVCDVARDYSFKAG